MEGSPVRLGVQVQLQHLASDVLVLRYVSGSTAPIRRSALGDSFEAFAGCILEYFILDAFEGSSQIFQIYGGLFIHSHQGRQVFKAIR